MESLSEIIQRLLEPIDPSRVHQVGTLVSYHGRFMVFAWGILVPFFIVIARFFKIWPGQNWPKKLDNPTWWRLHWKGQTIAIGLTVLGLALILFADHTASSPWHRAMGYVVVCGGVLQGLSGYFRGSKGGPTAPAPDGALRGDHYDMTPWRRKFELLHKGFGYSLFALSAMAILTGLWAANGPLWMWIAIIVWWALLATIGMALQLLVGSYDTYQAIWGPDPTLPGNKMNYRSFGSIRPGDQPRLWRKPRQQSGK